MENLLNQLICFSRANSTQQPLFRLIQSCQKELDKSEFIGTFLSHLPKGYACLSNDRPKSCTTKSLWP